MDLSVREAALLTGRSPRTLRAQLARGEMPGVKRNGRWVLDRRNLPLTDDQRAVAWNRKRTTSGGGLIRSYRHETQEPVATSIDPWRISTSSV